MALGVDSVLYAYISTTKQTCGIVRRLWSTKMLTDEHETVFSDCSTCLVNFIPYKALRKKGKKEKKRKKYFSTEYEVNVLTGRGHEAKQ